ncbi:MAG: hypothetical protein KJZ59_10905 [Pararhodobacter sp.]|nr:hypothetical protein [Pararhodobacter sp.]
MATAKQIMHELADKLPEQATLDDAMYTLYVRQKIEEGLKDIAEGRVLSHEEAKRRLLGKTRPHEVTVV